jgi:hypothetical protein
MQHDSPMLVLDQKPQLTAHQLSLLHSQPLSPFHPSSHLHHSSLPPSSLHSSPSLDTLPIVVLPSIASTSPIGSCNSPISAATSIAVALSHSSSLLCAPSQACEVQMPPIPNLLTAHSHPHHALPVAVGEPLSYEMPFEYMHSSADPYIYTMEACTPYQPSAYCDCEFEPSTGGAVSLTTYDLNSAPTHHVQHHVPTSSPALTHLSHQSAHFSSHHHHNSHHSSSSGIAIDGDAIDSALLTPLGPFTADLCASGSDYQSPNHFRWMQSAPIQSNPNSCYTFVSPPFVFCDTINDCNRSCPTLTTQLQQQQQQQHQQQQQQQQSQQQQQLQPLHTPPDEINAMHCDSTVTSDSFPIIAQQAPLTFTSLQPLTSITPPSPANHNHHHSLHSHSNHHHNSHHHQSNHTFTIASPGGSSITMPSIGSSSSSSALSLGNATTRLVANGATSPTGSGRHSRNSHHAASSSSSSSCSMMPTLHPMESSSKDSLQTLSNLSVENSSFLKFPQKLWNIVNNCRSEAIQWSESGDSIVIHYERFQLEYLSEKKNIFKTLNINSFIRQLNLYGFKKVVNLKSKRNHQQHEFRHLNFRRDRSDLLAYVNRNYHAAAGRAASVGSAGAGGNGGVVNSNVIGSEGGGVHGIGAHSSIGAHGSNSNSNSTNNIIINNSGTGGSASVSGLTCLSPTGSNGSAGYHGNFNTTTTSITNNIINNTNMNINMNDSSSNGTSMCANIAVNHTGTESDCRTYVMSGAGDRRMCGSSSSQPDSQCKLISIRELERNKLERLESRSASIRARGGHGNGTMGISSSSSPSSLSASSSSSSVSMDTGKKVLSPCNESSPPIATTKIVYLSQLQSGKQQRSVRQA